MYPPPNLTGITFSVILLFLVFNGAGSSLCGLPQAFSFGQNNNWQLGDGSGQDRKQLSPVPVFSSGVLAEQHITAVSAGIYHGLVLSACGQVFSFGSCPYDLCGDGTKQPRNVPGAVNMSGVLEGHKIIAIAAGGDRFSVVLSESGQVFSFGNNHEYKLGDGTNIDRPYPVAVDTSGVLEGHKIIAIDAGEYHTLLLSATGEPFSFGWNTYGQLGIGTSASTASPVAVIISDVLEGHAVTAISAGGSHSLVLSETGQVFSFGWNQHGQLGDGTTQNNGFPAAVNTSGVLRDVVITAISAGQYHSLVLSATGRVFAFGLNSQGQLGIGNHSQPHLYPVAVNISEEITITEIAAGYFHSLFVSSLGLVFSCGNNDHGQLGDRTLSNRHNPVLVDMSGALKGRTIIAAAAARTHSHVLATWKHNVTVFTPQSSLYIGQSNVTISWSTGCALGDITIELIRDGSTESDVLAANYSGNSSPFTWDSVSASDAPRNDYRIRITSESDPTIPPTDCDTFEISTDLPSEIVSQGHSSGRIMLVMNVVLTVLLLLSIVA